MHLCERHRLLFQLRDELVRRQHGVLPGGAQCVRVGDFLVRRVHPRFRQPRAVRVHLVQEERCHLLPAALGVLGEGNGAVGRDHTRPGVGAAELQHLVAVELPHIRRRRNEAVTDPRRPARRWLAAAAHQERRTARPVRRRHHMM
jgi:hypothetical protein